MPEKVLTNEEFVKDFPEWTVEKIVNKLGIKERHITSEEETASDLAVKAAEKLFDEYKIDKSTIDFLIFCTQSADYILPTTACLIQDRLGLEVTIGALDINLGCSGFVTSLSVAKGLIESGSAKKVLLLTAETYTKYMHPRDKGNRTIFGDGASATLVGLNGIAEIGKFVFGTDGTGAKNLIVKTGGARYRKPINDLEFDEFGNPHSSDYIYMNGTEILNYTLDRIPDLAYKVLDYNNLKIEDIDLHVFHQANKYIANLQRRKLKIQEEKYYCCFEHTGNTVSSTIPIALNEAIKDGSIKHGYKVLSVAQGLGYTLGGVVLFF